MILYFLILERVTRACSLCSNSHNCTFMMCVLFCLTLTLILKCLLKWKTNELGERQMRCNGPHQWLCTWSISDHEGSGNNGRKMRMSKMFGELKRGWSLGTGKLYGRCCGEYQAQLVRCDQLWKTEEFCLTTQNSLLHGNYGLCSNSLLSSHITPVEITSTSLTW